jgi:hypothetical protein
MYDDTHSDHEPFDIDTPVKTIQAYAENYRPIEAIIIFVCKCPKIAGSAFMIQQNLFGIA